MHELDRCSQPSDSLNSYACAFADTEQLLQQVHAARASLKEKGSIHALFHADFQFLSFRLVDKCEAVRGELFQLQSGAAGA